MKTCKLFIVASLMLLSTGLGAQSQPPQQGQRPSPPKMESPKEYATKEADRMRAEVGLSDKQYKKVYNLIKKDREYRQSQAENMFGGMPPQGGPGMGGPGGGMGGPGMGGPDGGMMGGPGMGGPGGSMGGGMPPQMGQGQRPEGAPAMGPRGDIVTEEYLEKQEQKLQKILTPDQYHKWRSKHPAEQHKMPPMEVK